MARVRLQYFEPKKATTTNRKLATKAAVRRAPAMAAAAPRVQKKTIARKAKKKRAYAVARNNQVAKARTKLFGKAAKTAEQQVVARAVHAMAPARRQKLFKILCRSAKGKSPEDPDDLAGLIDAESKRVYSPVRGTYNETQGVPYAKPNGWVRFNVRGIESDDPCFGWSVGYHGTSPEALVPIVKGGVKSPAERNATPQHGTAGAPASLKGKTSYTSPRIEYSAHPVYTPLDVVKPLEEGEKDHITQILLQVRVDQARVYKTLPSTLVESHWPRSHPFAHDLDTNATMEWLLSDSDAIRVTGIMVRQLSVDTNEARHMYGNIACDFKGDDAPKDELPYKWTTHLLAHWSDVDVPTTPRPELPKDAPDAPAPPPPTTRAPKRAKRGGNGVGGCAADAATLALMNKYPAANAQLFA